MQRAVVILVLFLGFACVLDAQTREGSWSNLNRLMAGQGIEVIESSLKGHAGKFVTVTDELLTFKENGPDVSVKREDVVRVSTSSAPKRGEHALIGLVVGGAIGAGIGPPPARRPVSWGDSRAEFTPSLASGLVPQAVRLSAQCSPPAQPFTGPPLLPLRTEPKLQRERSRFALRRTKSGRRQDLGVFT